MRLGTDLQYWPIKEYFSLAARHTYNIKKAVLIYKTESRMQEMIRYKTLTYRKPHR